ncbi:MAG: ribosome recycling factor [bacterium]|nr:ribosome recycling factor [bacterium]
MINTIKDDAQDKMKKTIIKLGEEFSALRTGRANSALLDIIKVDVYGSKMPINQLANILIPEARVLEIVPWSLENLEHIEKAINQSPLELNPSNDGKLIRIVLPALTEDSRKKLVKHAKVAAENFKIAVRNERRDANTDLKHAGKNKEITEDFVRNGEEEVQKITNKYIKQIDEMLSQKEAEIMEV